MTTGTLVFLVNMLYTLIFCIFFKWMSSELYQDGDKDEEVNTNKIENYLILLMIFILFFNVIYSHLLEYLIKLEMIKL